MIESLKPMSGYAEHSLAAVGSPVNGDECLAVSVVCPLFNEEAIIRLALLRTVANLERGFGDAWELILVDDGSRDTSLTEISEGLSKLPLHSAERIRVLSLSANQGRGRALKCGIDAARAGVIVTTEVDCSWGDDIVRRLFDELRENSDTDFVVASPHRTGGGLVKVPPNRVFFTKVGNMLISTFFDSSVTMNTGMTRAYRSGVIQPLVVFENGKEFHLEVILKLLTLGFRVREIPATITWEDHRLIRANAPKRKSSTRIQKTINSHLRFIAIAQPVRYFAIFAVVSFILSLAFFIWLAYVWLLGSGPRIFIGLVGILLFLAGFLFTGFSVLFYEVREVMRDNWARSYAASQPPSARQARIVFDGGNSG